MTGEKYNSIDLWCASVIGGQDIPSQDFPEALKDGEDPTMASWTGERVCNLQCEHCLYPVEKSSRKCSEMANISGILHHLAGQVHTLLHEGRTLRPWHLDVFRDLRKTYPELSIGLIDNGTYAKHLNEFRTRDIRLDWLDISLDGMEEAHNQQRRSPYAFRDAVAGLKSAREVVRPRSEGGRVASLFTLTRLNYRDVEAVGHFLLDDDLADEMSIVPMTPTRASDAELVVGVEELREAWRQVVRLTQEFGVERVIFKIYHLEDLLTLSEVVGHAQLWSAICDCEVNVGRIICDVQGVPVTYFPLSIWPNETFLVDADGYYRVAHSMKYTLEELQSGYSRAGADISAYTVGQLTEASSIAEMYPVCVDQWWQHFGAEALRRETHVFRQIANQVLGRE